MKRNNGMVLIFCLMVLSVVIILTEQLIRSVVIGSNFTKTMITREHCEMLALGGINIAIAQLTFEQETDKKEEAKKTTEGGSEKKEGQEKEPPIKKFVLNLISSLNRWQTFNLNPKIDGFSGQIKICISSEHGKININEAFDFKKQEFKKPFQAMLIGLSIPGKIPEGEFSKRLTEYFKKRNKKLYDVTELMDVPGFEHINAFYTPPKLPPKGNGQPNADLALQDIFTLWTEDCKIDPMLLSDSLCAIFGVRRPRADDDRKLKEQFKKLASEFKDDWGKDWDANWKHLQEIYETKPKILQHIKEILSEKFSPKIYSVLSYAKVDQVEQQVLAIIKEVEEKSSDQDKNKEPKAAPEDKKPVENQQTPSSDKKTGKKNQKFFKIVRLYWL